MFARPGDLRAVARDGFDEAAAKFKRMVELDPGNRVLQRQLAETYGRAGKTQEAIKILEGILDAEKNNVSHEILI